MKQCPICHTPSPAAAATCERCKHTLLRPPRGVWLALVSSAGTEGRPLPDDGITIGRNEGDWVIPEPRLSSRHVHLRPNDSGVVIHDLGSTNGSFVDGKRVVGEITVTQDTMVVLGPALLSIYVPDLLRQPRFDVHRLRVHDPLLAQAVSAEVEIGQSFAFIGRRFFDSPTGRALVSLFDLPPPRPRLVPLMGTAPAALPGVDIAGLAAAPPTPAALCTDRARYRAGRDRVRVFVAAPQAAGLTLRLDLRRGDDEVTHYPLELDDGGAGLVTVPAPAPGRYLLSLRGGPTLTAEVTVTGEPAAPLYAHLCHHQLDDLAGILSFRLYVEADGTPLSGPVTIALRGATQDAPERTLEAASGHVRGELRLTGPGPHSLAVTPAATPDRAVQIPLPALRGSAATLSELGRRYKVARLPRPNARPARGLYVVRGGRRHMPIELDDVVCTHATLTLRVPVDALRVQILDAATPWPRPGSRRPQEPLDGPERAAYLDGEVRYREGDFAAAAAAFQRCREHAPHPHPNAAYYLACCYARLGRPVPALSSLRAALGDGWRDLDHLRADADLALLADQPGFQALIDGPSEISHGALAAESAIEVPFRGSHALLAVAAIIDGRPWEGWAMALRPDALALTVSATARGDAEPTLTVHAQTAPAVPHGSLYLIVRDARAAAHPGPAARMAESVIGAVEAASRRLAVGPVSDRLGAHLSVALAAPPSLPSDLEPAPEPPAELLAELPPEPSAGPAPTDFDPSSDHPASLGQVAGIPEVLSATLVAVRDGRVELTLPLAPGATELELEAFVMSGEEWARATASVVLK
ncbi:TPR end-of-group domain-containing protein [Haliangium sp.]|uniref:TPR end-of-group domain-containing protein n=1 Tax=Haliangium sp. TaxID=2663208 RepID=UPI003D09BAF1